MRPFVPIFARTLHAVALSLWLGGLVAIGAMVAPISFITLRGSSILTLAQANGLAGHIVGGSLHLFTSLCYGCGVALLLANALLLRHVRRRWALAGIIVTSLLLGTALTLGFYLTPTMDAAQAHGDLATFDRLHHLYEQVSSVVQMPLLLLLALFGALRDTPSKEGREDA